MSDGPAAQIQLRVFDGTRKPMSGNIQLLVRVRDGNQKEVVSEYYRVSEIPIFEVPVFNNFGDDYAVIVSSEGYIQAGFFPVKVASNQRRVVDLMLLPKNATFDFDDAHWNLLALSHPELTALLAHGTGSPEASRNRYETFMEQHPTSLACFFNLTTAMAGIHLPQGTPLSYLREVIWDSSFAQDRFFAYAQIEIVDQVQRSAAERIFAP